MIMKKLSILAVLAFCLSGIAAAQECEPLTSWPYKFQEFQKGTLYLRPFAKHEVDVNLMVVGNKIHYIDGDLVKEQPLLDVDSLRVADKLFINAGGEMLEVLASSDKAKIVLKSEVNLAAMNETGGAYGSSSATLGTMALSSLEGIGGTNSSKSINHVQLRANREDGQTIALTKKLCIYMKGRLIEARKSELQSLPGVDAKAFKAYVKNHKIRFNQPESLLQLTEFLSDKLN